MNSQQPNNTNITRIQEKIDKTNKIMSDNIKIAFNNTEKIEDLEAQTGELEHNAEIFQLRSTQLKNKLWWKDVKIKVIICSVLSITLIIIIAVSVIQNQQSTN
jgi:hypothetical protein